MAIKNRIQATPGTHTGWFLPRDKVEHMLTPVEDILRQCKAAHFTSILIRINGQDVVVSGDWIKYLEASTSIV